MFNLKKDGFSPSSSSYIGVDISESAIKLVEIAYRKKQFLLENYLIYPCDDLYSQENFSLALAVHFPRTNKIVMAISEEQVILRKFTVSKKLTQKEIKEYLLLEVEKMKLAPIDELMVDFQSFESTGVDRLEILCGIVRQETIQNIAKIFKGTPFEIVRIYLSSQVEETPEKLIISDKIEQGQWEKDVVLLKNAYQLAIKIHKKRSMALNFISHPPKKTNTMKIIIQLLIFLILIVWLIKKIDVNTPRYQPSVHHAKQKSAIMSVKWQHSMRKKGYSIHAIKMKGFVELLDSNGVSKAYALIQMPQGKINTITVGDKMGREQAKVIKISSKCITVMEATGKEYSIE